MKIKVHTGMNKKDALRAAKDLGCLVEPISGTGEVRIKCDLLPGTSVVINNRRKDAPRELTTMLKHVQQLREAA